MRISDWSSDVCSSDLKGRRRDRQPTVRPSANQSRKGIAIETDGFIDCRELSLGRLDAALGLLHRGAGFKTGVEASHDKIRSEEHTSELQSLMRISYAVFCLKKKNH